MGVTSGHRVLINEKLNTNHPDRAHSVNVITNGGFSKVNWEDFSL